MGFFFDRQTDQLNFISSLRLTVHLGSVPSGSSARRRVYVARCLRHPSAKRLKGTPNRREFKVRLGAVCIFNFPSLLPSFALVLCSVVNYFTGANVSQSIAKKEKRGERNTTLEVICCFACLFCLSVTFDAPVVFMFSSCGCLCLSYYPHYF